MQRNNPSLTPTETITALLVSEGMSNREIAQRVYSTPGTIANVVSACLSKLHLPNRAALAVWAIQQETSPAQAQHSTTAPYNPDDYRDLLVIAYYAPIAP